MTRIADVLGRRVWDSRGRPTVEAEIRLEGGALGRAIAPAGASTGSREARDLRDGGRAFGGLDVRRALGAVNGEMRAALRGMDVTDQAAIDAKLIALDGTAERARLGGNALVAVSMACAQAAAAHAGLPLWRHLAGDRAVALPVPQIQIFGGGAHASGRVDVQDYLVVCPGAGSFAEALEMTAEVYHAAGARLAKKGTRAGVADEGGWWPSFRSNEEALGELVAAITDAGLKPGADVAIALDIAATQLLRGGRYHLALENRALSADQMIVMLLRWCEAYPIVSIEDPLAEDDHEGMRAFTRAAGAKLQVIGDDYLVTSAARVKAAAAAGACNAVLLKPNQAGTLTETFEAWRAAQDAGWRAVVSARSGETEDTTIVHLAVGWGVAQLKVGSFARSERMAKWNEGLRIEEALGAKALPYPARKLFRK
ncbi:MAG TPA: phosphopyruvate hydratase [Burkholderiales bacterium]